MIGFMKMASKLAVLTALFVGAGVSAEVAAPGSTQSETTVEEIVVTALRRAEGTAIMDTALAIDAMTGTELEARGFISVMDAISTSPGVSVSRTLANGDAIQIRGVSAIIGDGVVGYYLDDLPYTRISTNESPDLNPYDLNRVEILRGPQGTLFGAGSQGGTVRILTRNPVMNEFSGKVTGAFGNTDSANSDLARIQGAVNIPLVDDKLAMRLVASYRDEDGYLDMPLIDEENYNELEQTSYRAKLLWTPNEQWSVLASYWYWEHETFSSFGNDDYEFTPAYLDLLTNGAIPAPARSVFADSQNELFGLTVSYSGDSFSFTSSTSYFDNPVQEGLPIVGFQSDSDFSTQQTFAQEFKFASDNEGLWNWTVGAIYLDMENQEDSETFGYSVFLPEPLLLDATSSSYASESWAVFGESIYRINENLEFTLGLRYFEDEREVSVVDPNREPVFALFGIANPRGDSWDKLTGRINLAWTPTEDSLYYLNIAEGFRSGGLNGPSAILDGAAIGINLPLSLDPDLVTSYEIGGKWALLDGSLNLESVIYYLDWEDIQTFSVFVGPGGNATGGALNGESATVLGFELAVRYSVGGLTLSVSGNYNDNEYDGAIAGSGVEDGDPISNVPDLTWNASAGYTWPVGNLTGIAFLGATYTDERTDYFPPAFSYMTDATTVVAGRVGVEAANWSLFLTGENLTDEDGEVSSLAVLDAFGVPPYRFRPRTFGVELNFQF